MRTHNYKKKKTAKTVKEAREIKKNIEALDFDYEMFACGNFTEKEPDNGTPWHITTGKGEKIQKLGYEYVYVKLQEAKDGKAKISPNKSTHGTNGKIEFYIY